MDNQIETSAGVKSAITEADVVAWLHSELARLDISGIEYFNVCIDSHSGAGSPVYASGYPNGCSRYQGERGKTVAEAVAKLRAKIPTGEMLAQQKREQAAKLLAEAMAIESRVRIDVEVIGRAEPQSVDLGNGVLVKDTAEHLREIGVLP